MREEIDKYMTKEIELLENKEMRDSLVERLDVLDKVGSLLLLDELQMATTEQVAKYFNATVDTIKMCVSNNREEIELDGYKTYKAKDIEEIASHVSKEILLTRNRANFKVTNSNGEEILSGGGRGVALFPKRAILRVGMLLRDSEVAKELRTRLLDIVHDAEHNTDIVDKVFQEIRNEQEIANEMSQAILQGDYARLSLLQTELIDLKNKRIAKLENNYDLLANSYTSFEDFKRVANARVRAITSSSGVPIEKVWSAYYSFLFDKEGINVTVRYKNEIERLQNERIELGKKPYSESTLKSKVNRLRTIKPNEYEKCLNALKGLAVKYDVDLEKVVKLDLND